MLTRREFAKLSVALIASLALEPPLEVWTVEIDQNMIEQAITVGGTNRDLGRLNVTCHIDVDAVFAAVKMIDPGGMIWTTKDQGKIWTNPLGRTTDLFSQKQKQS